MVPGTRLSAECFPVAVVMAAWQGNRPACVGAKLTAARDEVDDSHEHGGKSGANRELGTERVGLGANQITILIILSWPAAVEGSQQCHNSSAHTLTRQASSPNAQTQRIAEYTN